MQNFICDLSIFVGCHPLCAFSRLRDLRTACTCCGDGTFAAYTCIGGCFPLCYVFWGPYAEAPAPHAPGCGLLCCHTVEMWQWATACTIHVIAH